MGRGKTGQPAARALPTRGGPAASGESGTAVVDVASPTAGQSWERFGFSHHVGGTLPAGGQADVDLQVLRGTSAETATRELLAPDADKVKAAFVLAGGAGNFRYQLAVRTASCPGAAPAVSTAVAAREA